MNSPPGLIIESPMACPSCGSTALTHWSTGPSYGWACFPCALFVWDEHPGSDPHDVRARPLGEVPAPPGATVQVPVGLIVSEKRLREIIREEIWEAERAGAFGGDGSGA